MAVTPTMILRMPKELTQKVWRIRSCTITFLEPVKVKMFSVSSFLKIPSIWLVGSTSVSVADTSLSNPPKIASTTFFTSMILKRIQRRGSKISLILCQSLKSLRQTLTSWPILGRSVCFTLTKEQRSSSWSQLTWRIQRRPSGQTSFLRPRTNWSGPAVLPGTSWSRATCTTWRTRCSCETSLPVTWPIHFRLM